MALIAFLFMVLIGLGIATGLGVIIYLIVRRINEDTEPFERRSY